MTRHELKLQAQWYHQRSRAAFARDDGRTGWVLWLASAMCVAAYNGHISPEIAGEHKE